MYVSLKFISFGSVPFECPSSAQRKFRLALALTLNEKHSSEIPFKQNNHKVLAESMIYFVLCLYNIIQRKT